MSRERVLVTGASGLIGRAVVPLLRRRQLDVHEVSRRAPESLVSHATDLSNADAVAALFGAVSPTTIIHLAGGHHPTPTDLYTANVQTAVSVMNAAATLASPPRVILLGSSAEYGEPVGGLVTEGSPAQPVTEYGRVKLEATLTARGIAAASGIPLSTVRPFNIVSPELPATSALGNMRRQLVSGERMPRVVRCGRLDVVRDFVPIEVVVQALLRLLQLDAWPTVVNVCSGIPVILGDLLEAMARSIEVDFEIVSDPELAAIPAAAELVGDPSLLHCLGVDCQPTVVQLAEKMMEGADVGSATGS